LSTAEDHDWVRRTAEVVLARNPGQPVVCASGLSPSGPIHLGNLREIMVPHLVTEEVRRLGGESVHLLFWDDYDRLRKIPAGTPESWAEHLGRPLVDVPDPSGEYPSWAEHFKAPLRDAMGLLGIDIHEISQAEQYRTGRYADRVIQALEARQEIDRVLAKYRTAAPTLTEAEPDAADYYPYKVYCTNCGKDETAVTGYADGVVGYRCRFCGHQGSVDVRTGGSGKLVWKVDWPMRWAEYGVTFEAAGVDHSSPGSSFDVGTDLVGSVFGGAPPHYLGYSFVGTRGAAKMSSSAGGAPTPAHALRVFEAPIVRWLYARRRPSQAITIDFGPDAARTYDEWDQLKAKVAEDRAEPWEAAALDRSVRTSLGELPQPRRTVSFRVLSAVYDITAGDPTQMTRILRSMDRSSADLTLYDLAPRLQLAANWVTEEVPADQRTRVRDEPDPALLAALTPQQRQDIDVLLDRMAGQWNLEALTRLVYGAPKLRFGLALDDPPTAEVKAAQKEFFRVLYQLLVSAERGPRLPTLLLSLGQERLRRLLTGAG